MSNLNNLEKQIFEKLFNMKSGVILDFSNKSFHDFIKTSVNIDIFDKKYEKVCDELGYVNCSKSNRLRCFWDVESDRIVYKLLKDLLDYYEFVYDDEKDLDLLKKAKSLVTDTNSMNTNSNDEELFLQQEFKYIDISSLGLEESIVSKLTQELRKLRFVWIMMLLYHLFSLLEVL